MRLINTSTLQLEEFFNRPTPEYAILSHRWSDDEVSYKDYVKGRRQDAAGHKKIVDCCAYAWSRQRQYVWIDTCCIDKRSSAELSEAVNSMFRWYGEAIECYAYLFDVTPLAHDTAECDERGFTLRMPDLQSSTWFTRGWTLQELLAPTNIVFLAKDWTILGFKNTRGTIRSLRAPEQALNTVLAHITGVPEKVLSNEHSVHQCSVAQRMSWAAERQTTRPEDQAYCLLGIFDINMPLIYGEGSNAFRRLQQEIIRSTSDETIFAFDLDAAKIDLQLLRDEFALHPYSRGNNSLRRRAPALTKWSRNECFPLIATSPRWFSGCGSIVPSVIPSRPPYTITNKGIEFRLQRFRALVSSIDGLPSEQISRHHLPDCIFYVLSCYKSSAQHTSGQIPYYCWMAFILHRCGHYGVAGTTYVNSTTMLNKIHELPKPGTFSRSLESASWVTLEQDYSILVHTTATFGPDGRYICG